VIDIANPPSPINDVGRLFNVQAMRPCDEVSAYIAVTNGRSIDLTYALTIQAIDETGATTSSLLDTDSLNGLQLIVTRCGATFTVCTQIVYSGPAIAVIDPMGGPDAVGTSGQRGVRPLSHDYLQLRVKFPIAAGNVFEDAQSILRLSWTSTQAL
jgi:hypothetical protein